MKKSFFYLLSTLLVVAVITSCKSKNDPSSDDQTPVSTRNDGSWIKFNELRSAGDKALYASLSFYSPDQPIVAGFCYKSGTSGVPTIEDARLPIYSNGRILYDNLDWRMDGTGAGSISGKISGLIPGTYRILAYMLYEDGTIVYGDVRSCEVTGSSSNNSSTNTPIKVD